MKLFMFPFAGGTSGFYMSWKKELSQSIDVIPVELSGRGVRVSEPFYIGLESNQDF